MSSVWLSRWPCLAMHLHTHACIHMHGYACMHTHAWIRMHGYGAWIRMHAWGACMHGVHACLATHCARSGCLSSARSTFCNCRQTPGPPPLTGTWTKCASACVCGGGCGWVCMCLCMCACMHACACARLCAHVRMCARMHACVVPSPSRGPGTLILTYLPYLLTYLAYLPSSRSGPDMSKCSKEPGGAISR